MKLLERKIEDLGKVAREAILTNTKLNDADILPDTIQDNVDNDNDDISSGLDDIPNVGQQYKEEVIASAKRKISDMNKKRLDPGNREEVHQSEPPTTPLNTKGNMPNCKKSFQSSTNSKRPASKTCNEAQTQTLKVLKYSYPGVT